MSRALSSLAMLAVVLLVGVAAADDNTPGIDLSSFAYSIELSPEGTRPVHSALLPLAVYRGVRSAELPDVRVFNAAGEQVSHAIRTLDARREVDLGATDLPLFPIYAKRADTQALEALSLRVERDARGTVIDVRPAAEQKPTADVGAGARTVLAYILDCSKLERPLVALRVQLQKTDADYVLPVMVEASDDLSSFDLVASGRPLVSLGYAGQRIERQRIELPAVRARYLRLRWSERELPAPIARIEGELGTEQQAGVRERVRVRGKRQQTAPQTYDFDLGGFVPADRVRVVLPEDNTLVQAELSSSTRASGSSSVPAYRGALYRIVLDGERVESPSIELDRRLHRYWQLRVDGKGGGLGTRVPELEIEYYPDQLLFVARGAAPFQLAYGHHAAPPTSFPPSEILALLPTAQRDQLLRPDTSCRPPRSRAGPAAFKPPPPPPPLKRYALWCVLILATLVLGVSAFRLSRSVAKRDGDEGGAT